ncbi:hypothetical protein OWR29_01690 [Actinoplanes sp. Pm04-4]|uniref:Uncharacterized protein n=1 Tax=Paractinoplanes pyxinae TaxID=2997416 RepID=A0ABT4ATL4_9ACTN|nr:hypothetical protein [Actinoplanes pyxinae]MCY1136693.1 hypothetical protein [Actinoplanes pyxinae]
MERIMYGVLAVAGVLAIFFNRRFGISGVESSRSFFGRDPRPGSREHRFTMAYGRAMAVLVGAAMVVFGALGVVGIFPLE